MISGRRRALRAFAVAATCGSLVVVLALPARAAAVPQLRRAPYLTDVSTSTATVNLATDTGSPAPVIAWDTTEGGCAAPSHQVTASLVTSFTGTNGTKDYQFKAPIAGLSPGSAYCYRASQAGTDLLGTPVTFTSAPSPGSGGAFTFAVIGDWGAGTADEANVFAQIAASRPAFLMTVGDNVYNSGNQSEYGDLNGGRAFGPAYLPAIGGGTPIFPAQGNHGFTGYKPYLDNFPQDAVTAASGGTYKAESYCCAAGTSGTRTYASAWYAFTWGNARIYVLEAAWADGNGGYQGDFTDHWNGPVAGCGPCGAELAWLQSDLAANAAVPIKLAFFHYPVHSDSGSQSSDTYLAGQFALEGLLASGGVQIAFNGHAHIYERNLPQIAGSPLVTYVTGGGGDALGGLGSCSAFDAYAIGSKSGCHAPKPTSPAQVYHFLSVRVDGNAVTVTPINELGQAFDVQTYTYGPPPAPTVPGAPTGVTAVAGNASAAVSWTAPASDGGSPVSSYVATASPGGATCATTGALGCTVTGLANGTTYTVTVVAANAIGPGPASAPSNPVTPSTPPAGPPTFVPIADAYVTSAVKSANYGTTPVLQVGISPTYHSYLMFDVEGLAGRPSSAVLRLWTNTAGSGSSVHGTGTAWTEAGIVYSNAPSYGSTVSTVTNFSAGTWISFNVTSLVTGNGLVAFAYTSASSTPISFASREDAGHAPQLVVTP
jgi:hypothetical protein